MGDRNYIVYLHINKINGKVYVGITHHVENPNRRWINGKGYRTTSIIHKAIVKYGWNNFKHIIFCKTSKEKACLLEQTLIRLYKDKNKSYNIGLGGEGSNSFSEETKEKLRQYTPWIKGKKHNQTAIEKIRQAGRRPCSKETKRKISIANRGKKSYITEDIRLKSIEAIRKPVLQFSKNNVFIREFKSASEAERFLNKNGHHINCCCNGKRKTAYGYKWRYKI